MSERMRVSGKASLAWVRQQLSKSRNRKWFSRTRLMVLLVFVILLTVGNVGRLAVSSILLMRDSTGTCEPPVNEEPKVMMAVVGPSESGDVYVFNTLRVAMAARDPNTIHGYYDYLMRSAQMYGKKAASTFNAMRSLDSPMVLRFHSVDNVKGFTNTASLAKDLGISTVFLTYRNPLSHALTRKRMGLVHEVQKTLGSSDICSGFVNGLDLASADFWSEPQNWVAQARAAIECTKRLEEWTEGVKLVKVKYEESPIGASSTYCSDEGREWIRGLLREIPRMPGSSGDNVTHICRWMGQLTNAPCTSLFEAHPYTQMRRGNPSIEGDLTSEEQAGLEAIRNDPFCKSWMQEMHYK